MYGPDGDAITDLEPGPGRGKEALLMLYDAEIRDPLVWFLEEKYGKIRILDEIPIGKSRADMLLVTENWLAGIEIKSDMDSYARLMSQVQSYDRYLDRNILVVGASHEKSAVEHVPEYWGIIAARGTRHRISFSVVREPEVNPRMRDRSKLELLWKRELQNLVRKKTEEAPSAGSARKPCGKRSWKRMPMMNWCRLFVMNCLKGTIRSSDRGA